MDDDGAALAGGGDGAQEVAAAVPVDGLDGGADGELEQHALGHEGRAGAGPLGWGFLLDAVGGGCGGGSGGAVGCVAEAGVEDVAAGLLGGIADDGRRDEEEVLARGGGQDEGVLAGAPSHHVDGLRLGGRAELGAPFLVAVERPDADGAVVAARGDPLAVRAEGDGAHAARVALEDGLAHGREGPQLLGARQLGQQRAGVDVEPVLADPGRQVEVEAALEALLDELAVRGHLAQGVKLAGQVLLLPLLGVELLPVVLLLRGGQVLGGRVVAEVVARRRELGRGDVHDMSFLGLLVGPDVVVLVLLLRLWLRRPVGQDLALLDGAHQLGYPLGFVF